MTTPQHPLPSETTSDVFLSAKNYGICPSAQQHQWNLAPRTTPPTSLPVFPATEALEKIQMEQRSIVAVSHRKIQSGYLSSDLGDDLCLWNTTDDSDADFDDDTENKMDWMDEVMAAADWQSRDPVEAETANEGIVKSKGLLRSLSIGKGLNFLQDQFLCHGMERMASIATTPTTALVTG